MNIWYMCVPETSWNSCANASTEISAYRCSRSGKTAARMIIAVLVAAGLPAAVPGALPVERTVVLAEINDAIYDQGNHRELGLRARR